MATRKEAKKDIRSLTEMVIFDAIELSETLDKQKDKEKVYQLIAAIAETHNDLISRVNKPDGKKNTSLIKAHYRAIYDELLSTCDKAYEQMKQLIPAK